MKLFKSKLDAEQELMLLKADSIALRFAIIGLLASILIQAIMEADPAQWTAEYIVLLIVCAYIMLGYLKHGIFYRFSEPGIKTYLRLSLLVGIIAGVFTFFCSALHGPIWSVLIDTALLFTGSFISAFAEIVIFVYVCKRRRKKIEERIEKSV